MRTSIAFRTLTVLLILAGPAFGGWPARRLARNHRPQANVTRSACTATTPAQVLASPQVATVSPQASGDPTGFVATLNAIRAQYGLRAVGYDPGLAGFAASNNAHQAARGLGHHVLAPGAAQNAAQAADVGTAARMWMNSAPHRATMLSASISVVGFHASAGWASMNAR